jgi:hypothetical protein
MVVAITPVVPFVVVTEGGSAGEGEGCEEKSVNELPGHCYVLREGGERTRTSSYMSISGG